MFLIFAFYKYKKSYVFFEKHFYKFYKNSKILVFLRNKTSYVRYFLKILSFNVNYFDNFLTIDIKHPNLFIDSVFSLYKYNCKYCMYNI